jgi:predicted ribosome quality control (RQC) complex YloA/Tae2 family protein
MDGFTLSFMERELRDALLGGRVDKLSQPERDTLLIVIRSRGENHRLLLSANANQARIQLTGQNYENPAEPPMFCMLARKHLSGARVTELRQIGGDRIIEIRFEGVGELGDVAQKTLYLEMMGRHSNLILTDARGVILDSIKHVNREMSRVRVVLPGQPYALPPGRGKLEPGTMTADMVLSRLEGLVMPLCKGLAECVAGMASVCAGEVCARLGLDPETECRSLPWAKVAPALVEFFRTVHQRCSPVLLKDELGVGIDFFAFPYLTFPSPNQEPQPSLSKAMDAFYLGRDLRLRMRQRGAGLQKHIKNAIERLEKKRSIWIETLEQPEKTEQHRVFGDLLMANLYQLTKGQELVTLPNEYYGDRKDVTIPLSPQHTPIQNAQRYYAKYRKAKVASEYAATQLEKANQELDILENAMEDLEKCETSADLAEVRYVLVENGFLRPEPMARGKKKAQEGKPYRFLSEDGTEILVGKNALQNDRLTLHARGNELWLHAQAMPGSHVSVRTEAEPSEGPLLKAAKLAAYFSKGRNHPALPVDYTRRKHVKKAAGSPAGLVTYTHFQTVFIGLTKDDLAAIGKESAK